MQIRAFLTHKLSEKYKDCQDSFDILESTNAISIADGISQSIFPKIWADLLTYNYVCTPTISYSKEEDINPLRIKWAELVEKVRYQKEMQNDPFLWKLEENLATGKSAGATFLGLKFKRNVWSCSVIGDSCLIEISERNEISRIISSKSEGEVFDNHPDYLDSSKIIYGKGVIEKFTGELTDGKKLFLVTDALSDFLFKKQKEKDFAIVEKILNVQTQIEFEDLVSDLRLQGMHNDDTTLVIVENDNNEIWNIEFQTNLVELIKAEEEEYRKIVKDAVPEKMFDPHTSSKSTLATPFGQVVDPENIPLIITDPIDNGISILNSQTNPVDQENIKNQIISLLDSCNSEQLRIQVLVKIINSLYSTHSAKYSKPIKRLKKEVAKLLH